MSWWVLLLGYVAVGLAVWNWGLFETKVAGSAPLKTVVTWPLAAGGWALGLVTGPKVDPKTGGIAGGVYGPQRELSNVGLGTAIS